MSGDYTLESSVYIMFTTRAFGTGAPSTLSAGATVAVYEDVTASPIDTAIAVTEDHNSVTGLNSVTIAATAANGFNGGGHYHVVIDSASTVDSVSVQGEVVGEFTIGVANDVNVTQWLGSAVQEDSAGHPKVTIKDGSGQGEIITTTGAINTVNMVLDQQSMGGSTVAVNNWVDYMVACHTGTVTTGTHSTTSCVTSDLNGYADGELVGREMLFASGIAKGQATICTSWTNSTQTLVYEAISTAPVNGDTIVFAGMGTSASMADIQSRLPAALVSGKMDSNVGAISDDTTAADNLEADYDGTGYNKSASTIGTTTTNTDMVAAAPSAATITSAVWGEALPGAFGAGTAGEILGDWKDAGRLDAILDQILADTGTDGVAISATTANEIADALLKRDWNSVSGEAARSALNALRFLRNKYSISGDQLTVTQEDDTTSAWTSTLTTNAAADPVTGSDPA